MSSPNADRNLLYGVLALQMGFVNRDSLITALHSWVSSKSKSLSQILLENNLLSRENHPAVEYAVRRHLEKSEYDPAQCLTSLDVELAGSVKELLRAIDDADMRDTLIAVEAEEARRSTRDLSETTAQAPFQTAEILSATELIGSRFDPFRSRYSVVRPHAKGGLGEVFVAWDEELGREVALKEIRREHATDENLRARFVREAEVNGNLEHPGIVPVYGLGVHPDGRPYYAMRFVEGETLHAALVRFHLDAPALADQEWTNRLRGLLRRFVDVCNAIAYAHNRGVLHRDLKPANILLGTFGETLIIDWGLAKVKDEPETRTPQESRRGPVHVLSSDSTFTSTLDGETLGSPPFMSPEQASGRHEELDKASDVYNLGATLYAILTGQPPIQGKSVKEMITKAIRGDFPPVRTINPRVPKALDAVCAHAMKLEPTDRYPSARALADDIESWIADQPVSVYTDPVSTRMLRWARHHRTIAAVSLALLLTVLSGLSVGTALINQQKKRAEDALFREQQAVRTAQLALVEAQRSAALAKDHLNVGLDLLDQVVALGDGQMIAQQSTRERLMLMEQAHEFIRRFHERDRKDSVIQTRTSLVARRLANLYRLTGDAENADRLYGESIGMLEGLSDPALPTQGYDEALALALMDRGVFHLNEGRAAAAGESFQKALRLAQKGFDARPASPQARRLLGICLSRLGMCQLATGNPEARQTLRQAVEKLQALADGDLAVARSQFDKNNLGPLQNQFLLVAARYKLAEALLEDGKAEEAGQLLRAAHDQMNRLANDFDGLVLDDLQFYQAWTAGRLARALAESSARAQSYPLWEQGEILFVALVQRQPDVAEYRFNLAELRVTRARARLLDDNQEQARSDTASARDLADALIKTKPGTADYLSLRGQVSCLEAELMERQGAVLAEQAQALWRRALDDFDAAARIIPGNAELKRYQDACRARITAS